MVPSSVHKKGVRREVLSLIGLLQSICPWTVLFVVFIIGLIACVMIVAILFLAISYCIDAASSIVRAAKKFASAWKDPPSEADLDNDAKEKHRLFGLWR